MDKLVENLNEDGFVILKEEFPDKWQNLNKKLAYEYFNNIDDYKKPVDYLQKEDFFSKLKKCPEDDEITRTKEIIKVFDVKNGEDLSKILKR